MDRLKPNLILFDKTICNSMSEINIIYFIRSVKSDLNRVTKT